MPDGSRSFTGRCRQLLCGVAAGIAMIAAFVPAADAVKVPAWVPGYRVRYTIRVEGDLVRSSSKTVMVTVPTGGWLRPDAADLLMRNAAGEPVPMTVLGHDPKGDTLIQFRRNGNDRNYFLFASNPAAARDVTSAQKIEDLRKAAQEAVLTRMALAKTSAQKAAEHRDIKATVDSQEAFLKGTVTELASWEKLVPERTTAAKTAADKVPPAKAAAEKATAALVPFQKTADDKTAVATPLLREAAEALRAAQQAAQALAAAKAAADAAVKAIAKAEADAVILEADATKAEAAAKRAADSIASAQNGVQEADQDAKRLEQEAAEAAAAVAGAKKNELARVKRQAADKNRDAAAARQTHTSRVRRVAALKTESMKRTKAAETARAASKAAPGTIAAAKTASETAAKNVTTAEAAKVAADKTYAAKDAPAKKADEEAKAARLAAAPYVAAKQKADTEYAQLLAASNAANASLKQAQVRVKELTATKQQTEAKLAVSRPQMIAAKKVMDDTKTAADNAVADAVAKDKAYVSQAESFDPRAFKEGISVEYREWAGDKLSSWPEVVKGLERSDNVLGTAMMGEVVQNVNPYRRSDPRNFASSYRGFIKIDKPGIYSFFVNSDDAAFMFLGKYRVYSRTGTNPAYTGRVALYSVGSDIQLDADTYAFEVHHVVGNTPDAKGVCSLLWLTPGSKQWQFVPRTAFTHALVGVVEDVAAFDGNQIAMFEFGMDDALSADGMSMYLARFEPSGKINNPDTLQWTFGDKTTAKGKPGQHLYFREGDVDVSLQSHPQIPPFKRRCHIYTPANPTDPHSLGRAVAQLAKLDFTTLDVPQLNDLFHFLLICEQSTRWPVLERLCRELLKKPDLDLKYRTLIYVALMESLAEQGRGDEALQLAAEAKKAAGKMETLRARVQLEVGHVDTEFLKDYKSADKIFSDLITDCARLRHPLVREAAVSWGDMFIDSGDLGRAGTAFRLAKTLGVVGLVTEGQNDAATRGAYIRMAEQLLRDGNIRQSRRMLQRIEAEFPDQKLEGPYRYLRGDSRRGSGRYELAIRDYEVLLQLRQWAGYKPSALFGLADSNYRMGELEKAKAWLEEIKLDHPEFWRTKQLDVYEKNLTKRIERQAKLPRSADGKLLVKPFTSATMTFEPQENSFAWKKSLSQGIDGPTTVQGNGAYKLPPLKLENLPNQGTLWVEVWYRTHDAYPAANPSAFVITATALNEAGTATGEGTLYPAGTHAQWHKATFNLAIPPTQNGSVVISGYSNLGWLELDGLRVTHVSDAVEDSLRNFIEGANPQ